MPPLSYVYILASDRNGTLYLGVTSDLRKRVWEHAEANLEDSFTARHRVHRLVYYEQHHDIREAILREKRMKKWRREWKIALIEQANPYLRDLSVDLGVLT